MFVLSLEEQKKGMFDKCDENIYQQPTYLRTGLMCLHITEICEHTDCALYLAGLQGTQLVSTKIVPHAIKSFVSW